MPITSRGGGMRLSPHRLKTADARQGVGASHLTTYFERVYLNNLSLDEADAGEFVCVAIYQERNGIIMRYDNFFSDETKEVFKSGDFRSTDNAVLMAMLDDIVQVIADKSNEEWATDNSIEHKVFRKLVKEIGNRLN